MNRIGESNLFIGSRLSAENKELLSQNNISYILTIQKEETTLEYCRSDHKKVEQYFITSVVDMNDANLIHHLPFALQFLQSHYKPHHVMSDSQESCVLVHCEHGVSRSCAVVCAFILSIDDPPHNIDDCINFIAKYRPEISINEGFYQQLRLFQKMNYKIDEFCVAYKLFRVMILKMEGGGEKFCSSVKYIRCKKCRKSLIPIQNIIPHSPPQTQPSHVGDVKKTPPQLEWYHLITEDKFKSPCQYTLLTFAISHQQQSNNIKIDSNFGNNKIWCKNCASNLGRSSLITPVMCGCGLQIVPDTNIYIFNISKIDYSPPPQL